MTTENENLTPQEAQRLYLQKRDEYVDALAEIRDIKEQDPYKRDPELQDRRMDLNDELSELSYEIAGLKRHENRRKYERRVFKRIAKAAAAVAESGTQDIKVTQWEAMLKALDEMDEFEPGWND